MRNNSSKAKKAVDLVAILPYFFGGKLFSLIKNKSYLKIILSRYAKAEKIIRLKQGLYVSRGYIDSLKKKDNLSDYS